MKSPQGMAPRTFGPACQTIVQLQLQLTVPVADWSKIVHGSRTGGARGDELVRSVEINRIRLDAMAGGTELSELIDGWGTMPGWRMGH